MKRSGRSAKAGSDRRAAAPILAGLLVVAVVVGAAVTRQEISDSRATRPARQSSAVSSPASSPAASTASSPGSSPASDVASPIQSPPDSASTQPLAASWHDGGTATFAAAEPPASTMIDGANDLLASDGEVFAATDAGIARSADAGASWRYVLTGADMWAVAKAGTGFVALGHKNGPDGNGPAVVATSPDGVSWEVTLPAMPQQPSVAFGYGYRIAATGVGPGAVDVAVPDVAASAVTGPALRSIDGGHTWVKVTAPLDTGLDLASDGKTMYATGDANAAGCVGAVYRSTDLGVTWSLLGASCQDRPLYAVDFVDADHGFAAGGTPVKGNGSDVVESTDDGGKSWQVLWSTPLVAPAGGGADNEFIRLTFADAEHGYAVSGGCTMGGNGPCGGRLYATSDGGHSWHQTGQTGLAVAVASAASGTVGSAEVYLGGEPGRGEPALSTSTDAAQHWTPRNGASTVDSQAVEGRDDRLSWQTTLGSFSSSDNGNSWSPSTADDVSPDPADEVQDVASGPGTQAVEVVGLDDDCSSPQMIAKMALVKPGWTPETQPAELEISADAGESWRRVTALPFPVSLFGPGALAIDGNEIALMDRCGDLELSNDAGRSWSTITSSRLGTGCTIALYGKEIWLNCPSTAAHSPDFGATWTSFTTNPGGVQRLAQAIDAIGPDTALVSAGGSLWRTGDGGAHWSQSWPALAGES